MSPGLKRIYFALACAAIGFFVVSSLAPKGGARGFAWVGDVFGHSGFTLGAVGAGIGLVIGLVLASMAGGRSKHRDAAAAVADSPGERGPGEEKRQWLRARRKRDAPKRFGRRGR